jgi:hypothetical protein
MLESVRLYVKWCIAARAVLPWQVSLVSDRELTQEEYDWPEKIEIPEEYKKAAIAHAI